MSGKGEAAISEQEKVRRKACFFVNNQTSQSTGPVEVYRATPVRKSQEELRALHLAQQQQQPSSPSPPQQSYLTTYAPPGKQQGHVDPLNDRRGSSVAAGAAADTESENSRDAWFSRSEVYDAGEPQDEPGCGKKHRTTPGGERPNVLGGAAGGIVQRDVTPALSEGELLRIEQARTALQAQQLGTFANSLRLYHETNNVMSHVIDKMSIDRMRHPHPDYEVTSEDLNRVNEFQEAILQSLAIGYVDPRQNLMEMARAEILTLKGTVATLTQELLVANVALQVSS